MDEFWHNVNLFIGALFAIALAFFGGLTRLFHEHSHGVKPLTAFRVIASVPAAIIMGVLGHATGEYLYASQGFPAATGGALAGILGYLGPTVINEGAAAVTAYLKRKYGGDNAE